MPHSFARSAPAASPPPRDSSSFPAIAAPLARRTGSHRSHKLSHHLSLAIVLVLLSANGVAHAQAGDRRVSAVTSESGRFARFVSEAALRFGIPTSWINAVMQAESRGVVRAVSPKGAMGLMQIMPDTWSGLRARYGLGADPFDPHDNILAGAAYLRELHDRYGALGFLAAYNAGPGRYEDHLATGHPLPTETRAYVAALAPLLRDGGSEPGNIITAIIRSWTDAPLFSVRRRGGSTVPPPSSDGVSQQRATATSAADWTGLAPQSEGLFARLSARGPRP
ncbi:soluble lytic murein transglycosylase [Hyphomicrobium denitrificans 1NES1]|uniref:Soluble lytic murein transglycosylase n=1 Tax=Hyphomicrobium denitrificans 1NES1 TaxID=670307 RepID=N0BHY3_9HYPH|nr:lytic transglycosylase domain-containing protein [Hyphomicrobium denitrificans]AGK59770.1 soluble lytic murein transglycosylase [Hyphomicrobium denitrificans 1NES1]